MSKLLFSVMKIIDQEDKDEPDGHRYWKFRETNSPDEPSHEILPWGQRVAFGSALQLSIINLDRCEKKGINGDPLNSKI